MQKNDSAYLFLQQYNVLKDSVMNQQFMFRLSNYKRQADFQKQQQQVALLNSENRIKEEALKHASEVTWVLISALLLAALLGFIMYRNLSLKRKNEKLESEKTKAELQQQTTELEIQALRAQMNPHFIFNSLSSINRFILKKQTLEASDYLTKFSRLIRLILQNSQESLIPLDTELEALQLYLELEALRLDNKFDYEIVTNDDLDTGLIKVPPLIIQPFVENAIWHGLMHKKERGHLEIEMHTENEVLYCIIKDDGIGRKKAAEIKSKYGAESHKSMGIRITEERIAMLHQHKELNTAIFVKDLMLNDGTAGGTEVMLKIPIAE